MKFVFFGTPKFATLILETLKKNSLNPTLIITTQDKPAGRKLQLKAPPVKEWAKHNNIPVLQPEKLKSAEFISYLSNTKCLMAVVVAYGKIIPKEVLNIFPKGVLNVHPSLLPHWRGADPIRAAILAGDKKIGVTVMLIDEKMDHGPILAQQELEYPTFSAQYSMLETKLAELGGELLLEVLPKWIAGKIRPKEQEHSKATYTKKIAKGDGRIDWSESAEIIERKIKALNPWPGTFSFWKKNGKNLRINIIEAEVSKHPAKKPGLVSKSSPDLFIDAKDKKLKIIRLQLEGKKPQTAKDFLNGHSGIEETILD